MANTRIRTLKTITLAAALAFVAISNQACHDGPRASAMLTPTNSVVGDDAILYLEDSGSMASDFFTGETPRGGVVLLVRRDGVFALANSFPFAYGQFDYGTLPKERIDALVKKAEQLKGECAGVSMCAPDDRHLTLWYRSGGVVRGIRFEPFFVMPGQMDEKPEGTCIGDLQRWVYPLKKELDPFIEFSGAVQK